MLVVALEARAKQANEGVARGASGVGLRIRIGRCPPEATSFRQGVGGGGGGGGDGCGGSRADALGKAGPHLAQSREQQRSI